MATPVLIPVQQYLNTSYHPDCEYVDGEIKERTVGEIPHGGLQDLFSVIFRQNRATWGLRTIPEQRVQVSATRFRIPDISVLLPENSRDLIVHVPPVICIEILSREDTLSGLQGKIDDYLGMGVQNIWIVDPWERRAWTADRKGLHCVDTELTLPTSNVFIPLQTLWNELDDLAAGR